MPCNVAILTQGTGFHRGMVASVGFGSLPVRRTALVQVSLYGLAGSPFLGDCTGGKFRVNYAVFRGSDADCQGLSVICELRAASGCGSLPQVRLF